MSESTVPSLRYWPDWVGLAARLTFGIVLIVAAVPKLANIPWFIRSIYAYQLLPVEVANVMGYALPVVELVVGILLVLGLLTRPAAAVGFVLMGMFMVGIIWAWSQGLSIDCGCFGTGGVIPPEETRYPQELARDLGLAALTAWLVVRPRSLFSLDQVLFPEISLADEAVDDEVAEAATAHV
ncbi:MAG: MauE/DoxX family redox-associated membrane protein [Arachnia sp.]